MNQGAQSKKEGNPNRAKIICVVLMIIILVSAAIYFANKNIKSGQDQTANVNGPTIPETKDQEAQWPSLDAKYITAVPLDLTQIQTISKYRSCAGHDRSGYSFEQVLETDRSMKHYFYPTSEFQGTIDKVKIFAPFDGKVVSINLEKDKVGGRPNNGNGITFSTPVDKNVEFQFGHIYFVKDFKVGDSVKAGELIGYATLGDKGFDFDIDLMGVKNGKIFQEILGSTFDHMTDSVLAEFAKYGITPENTKVTKEYRDTNQCHYDTGTGSQGRENNDWVQLKH